LAGNVAGMGVRKIHRGVRRENVNKRGHMEDLGLHKKIILKRIINKYHGRYGLFHLSAVKTEMNLLVP
jgi:hypothetical protein